MLDTLAEAGAVNPTASGAATRAISVVRLIAVRSVREGKVESPEIEGRERTRTAAVEKGKSAHRQVGKKRSAIPSATIW